MSTGSTSADRAPLTFTLNPAPPPGVPVPHAPTVRELALRHGGRVDAGAADRVVSRVVRPQDASERSDLIVVARARHVDAALSAPGVVLCDDEVGRRLPSAHRWQVDDARCTLAAILAELPVSAAQRGHVSAPPAAGGARASIHPGAQLGLGVVVGDGAVIHPHTAIGDGSVIGERAVIYPQVRLGSRVVIGAGSVIGGVGFGWVRDRGGQLRRMPHPSGVVIEDGSEIGALCTVDAGVLSPTWIGAGSRLDAQVHVGHNAEIGRACMIAAQVGLAGSVVLGDSVLVGGQSGFADGVRVGDGARIAAKSGVISDLPAGATVAGFPAVAKARWLRAMARLLRPQRWGGSA